MTYDEMSAMDDQGVHDYDETDEEEYYVREAAKRVLLPWYHGKACTPSQGCSCDLAREEYASMPTAGLTFAAEMVRGLA